MFSYHANIRHFCKSHTFAYIFTEISSKRRPEINDRLLGRLFLGVSCDPRELSWHLPLSVSGLFPIFLVSSSTLLYQVGLSSQPLQSALSRTWTKSGTSFHSIFLYVNWSWWITAPTVIFLFSLISKYQRQWFLLRNLHLHVEGCIF